MGRRRKARGRLPRAVKQAIKAQRDDAVHEDLAPLLPPPAVLRKPPGVRQPPQLPASTRGEPSALVASSSRPDTLLRAMGEQVLVGRQLEGACEFWIELKQDILDGLQIRVSLLHGRLSATMIVTSDATEALLRQRLPQLQRKLRARGLTVEHIEILVHSGVPPR